MPTRRRRGADEHADPRQCPDSGLPPHLPGALTSARALEAIDKLAQGYVDWSRAVPVIAQLTPGLQTLRERLEAGETEVFDDAFRARWTAFVASVGEFKAARERDAAAGA
jgi:hypothetical protein